ncbi:hypothetical protein BC941DRAFT_448662 [Chlamydoabsidia padenii]|nr:hypothetical protein BC941DRAFT_448662 [Chlamydoabsidia padenii]
MAIVSPIFFSPSLTPGSLRTSLPGTWVDSSPYQFKQDADTNNEKENNHTLSNAQRHYHQRFQQQQQTTLTKCLSPATSSSPVVDQLGMHQLRETIASLKERARQLEQTDLMVKKSIEIVAKKRLLAHHQRRQHSQWDWCDQPNDLVVGDQDNTGVPVLDNMDDGAETDHSEEEEEEQEDGCGGDWEWID